jgi:hypothetical protein
MSNPELTNIFSIGSTSSILIYSNCQVHHECFSLYFILGSQCQFRWRLFTYVQYIMVQGYFQIHTVSFGTSSSSDTHPFWTGAPYRSWRSSIYSPTNRSDFWWDIQNCLPASTMLQLVIWVFNGTYSAYFRVISRRCHWISHLTIFENISVIHLKSGTTLLCWSTIPGKRAETMESHSIPQFELFSLYSALLT